VNARELLEQVARGEHPGLIEVKLVDALRAVLDQVDRLDAAREMWPDDSPTARAYGNAATNVESAIVRHLRSES
jgi:hypothetical protein